MMCGLGASGNPAAADRARQGVHVPVHPAEEGGGHHPFDQRVNINNFLFLRCEWWTGRQASRLS